MENKKLIHGGVRRNLREMFDIYIQEVISTCRSKDSEHNIVKY